MKDLQKIEFCNFLKSEISVQSVGMIYGGKCFSICTTTTQSESSECGDERTVSRDDDGVAFYDKTSDSECPDT